MRSTLDVWTVSPVEHPPDKWVGELDGLYVRHGAPPIPVTVKVQWSDGTTG
jgi:hypothetical protein